MKLLVYTNPVADQEQEFNAWYDDVHVKELLEIPGLLAATRFKVCPLEPDQPLPHSYLAVYDVESEGVMHEIIKRSSSGQLTMSPAMDVSSMLVNLVDEM